MPTWAIWAAAIAAVDFLIILFIHGADTRRDRPDWS